MLEELVPCFSQVTPADNFIIGFATFYYNYTAQRPPWQPCRHFEAECQTSQSCSLWGKPRTPQIPITGEKWKRQTVDDSHDSCSYK